MTVLLDASAVLAFLQGERGAQVIRPVLGESLVLSVNWSEVLQQVTRRSDRSAAEVGAMLVAVGVEVEPLWRGDAERAAEMWSIWPHLSLADRCCLAAAERLDVIVYTADGEWASLDSSVRVELIR
jgi:PIN domain nuclease of toxin-antitoxin system